MVVAISMFILAVTGVDSFKLQATAEWPLYLNVRIRTVAADHASRGDRHHQLAGQRAVVRDCAGPRPHRTTSCGGIMIGIGWSLSFKRLGWVARRHFRQARHLVPGALISSFAVFDHRILGGPSIRTPSTWRASQRRAPFQCDKSAEIFSYILYASGNPSGRAR